MAFDFPASPTEGQTFAAPGGPTYVFNSPVWRAVGQGQIAIISDTPPTSPANGALWLESDTGVLYIWWNDGNSSQWVQVGGMAPPIMLSFVRQQFITTSGAITLHADTKAYQVEVQGGGGGGGSCTTGTASNAQPAPGGGAGGYCSKWVVRPAGTYNLTGTVGAAGAAAGNGGTSAFSDGTGNALNANGGVGGSTAYNATAGARMGSPGGTAAGGDINVTGDHGGYSYHASAAGYVTAMVQPGAASRFGAGGAGQVLVTSTAYHSGGNAASGYGAGGAGAINAFAGAAVPGGAGSPGCIIITEYR